MEHVTLFISARNEASSEGSYGRHRQRQPCLAFGVSWQKRGIVYRQWKLLDGCKYRKCFTPPRSCRLTPVPLIWTRSAQATRSSEMKSKACCGRTDRPKAIRSRKQSTPARALSARFPGGRNRERKWEFIA